ncbi:hypothetical protein ECC02_012531 [Trypanosoma cruzi]|uniref:Uncharacterized protein n=1 Tax=Trypanosoma cruzi TaxID=5693 RepID=A0A7J6XLU8_TRYCR|nr:hypothetical protein ECC02_012531 [Trypanosoma cruzi]
MLSLTFPHGACTSLPSLTDNDDRGGSCTGVTGGTAVTRRCGVQGCRPLSIRFWGGTGQEDRKSTHRTAQHIRHHVHVLSLLPFIIFTHKYSRQHNSLKSRKIIRTHGHKKHTKKKNKKQRKTNQKSQTLYHRRIGDGKQMHFYGEGTACPTLHPVCPMAQQSPAEAHHTIVGVHGCAIMPELHTAPHSVSRHSAVDGGTCAKHHHDDTGKEQRVRDGVVRPSN